jgi:hypothetical protein
MLKPKWSALISLVLVFLSGILVGAVANRLYMVNTVSSNGPGGPPPRRDPEEIKRHIVAETRDKVRLDDQQVARLNQIYDDERAKFGHLRQKWNTEGRDLRTATADQIRAILRPDQVQLFDQLQADREAARKRRMQNEKK